MRWRASDMKVLFILFIYLNCINAFIKQFFFHPANICEIFVALLLKGLEIPDL